MKDQTNCRRAFNWETKAWYNNDKKLREINFGMYSREGDNTGEMSIRWHELSGHLLPRLEVFYDSWYELSQFKDVIDRLAEVDGQEITQQTVVDILLSCGFEDITAYDNPYTSGISNLERELQLHESRAKVIRTRLGR